MTVLASQRITDAGLLAVYTAATSVIDMDLDDTVLHVKNGAGAPITVTAETPGTADGDLAVADRVITVANATDKFIGPFGAHNFKNATTGKVKLTLSSVTTITVAALTL